MSRGVNTNWEWKPKGRLLPQHRGPSKHRKMVIRATLAGCTTKELRAMFIENEVALGCTQKESGK